MKGSGANHYPRTPAHSMMGLKVSETIDASGVETSHLMLGLKVSESFDESGVEASHPMIEIKVGESLMNLV